jgi:hypothetical protein
MKEELQETEELIVRNNRQTKKEYLENIRGEFMEFQRTGRFD